MDISKTKYSPQEIEKEIYEKWLQEKYFESIPNEKPSFTVVIPPPNVTGVLHMGHILNNTIQDILCRRERMRGKNVCWVPGTDHASIATEAKVTEYISQKGIDKKKLTREEFNSYAWDWTKKHGGIILEQLKKIGASCDWSRTKFTLDKDLSESVIQTFIDLYEKGRIYRGTRMVHWDCKALTALSDEEVFYKEQQSILYHIRYPITDSEYLAVATTRPETMFGDTAVCVNPNDTRYQSSIGKEITLPLTNRKIPVIFDEYVDIEYGTGCLKITPAHDPNDHVLGKKHNLEEISIFTKDGKMNERTFSFEGLDRFKARKEVVKALSEKGFLLKEETITNNVGYSERTNVVVEPRVSTQWFCKMKKIAEPALKSVKNNTIHFYPKKFVKTYSHWMESIQEWCISRQLYWGHQIPIFYTPSGKEICAKNIDEAVIIGKKKFPEETITKESLVQDEDVLDTWFSSWLWPISVFDGIRNPQNEEIKYYYPTNVLVTAPEIIFFWVARMIMSGYEYRQEIPFKNVYFTGIVRDKKGRKMSKSLGNSPDPLTLIEEYGADAVRLGMMLSSPAGNDLLYDEKLILQGRNFSNKLFNAARLISMWKSDKSKKSLKHQEDAVEWFGAKLNQTIKKTEKLYEEFRVSDVLMTLYRVFWDDFCSIYLELIKEKDSMISHQVFQKTTQFFGTLLQLFHPFVPFITESLWKEVYPTSKTIMFEPYPKSGEVNETYLSDFDMFFQIAQNIRNVRKEAKISFKQGLNIEVILRETTTNNFRTVVEKLTNADISEVSTFNLKGINTFSGKNEITIEHEEKESTPKNAEKEIERLKGFLKSISSRLNNQRFLEKAPKEIIEKEKKKAQDAKEKIETLEAVISKK